MKDWNNSGQQPAVPAGTREASPNREDEKWSKEDTEQE